MQESENNKDNMSSTTTSNPLEESKEASAVPGEQQPENSAIGSIEPTNFLTKHPLQNRWTWWYDNPGKKKLLSLPGEII